MAEEKLVKREMLTNTYLGGTDHRRGDVVEITEAQAARFDELGATAKPGFLEKLAQERADAVRKASEAEATAREAADERLRAEREHAEGVSVEQSHIAATGTTGEASGPEGPNVPTGEPPVGSDGGPKPGADGPKPDRSSGTTSRKR